ncbi:unnamed protein product [Arabidopsis lyrata]|uniref:F-box domain-containing protein n=1 Tax=Arabidopsis lyrata subsp. lyrata TaxID=81972 RepID=D7M131_ARALL|nr:F-box/kelch-repeat protein At4g39550 [Arabidopsis lyrata subsp. lyrata]EFH51043.1 hypothetical protein ARALYDRAFT_911659 [Arabidopsis lyrata subsp. lyrata]CAH8273116.1 unnamed protein product [Arabidopsis lyrata]|eukprot:XP_002874784.1 F-box/kelch-repeat protein At4g39550 [Arabidopsis lyrata subsp. lyrata]
MSSPPTSPATTNGEEPLVKKQKKNPSQIPLLPDDVLVSCLARVSRLHYGTLSLVSKSFRSLIASPELYKTRSLLGRTESCLYVCLRFPPERNQRWFTLSLKPNNRTVANNNKSSCNLLVPVPTSNYPHAQDLGLVAVGSNIYNFGGSGPSSVSILDCQTHTWHEAPSMRVKQYYPHANVVDGKIYVAGRCIDLESSNWMEVFDPKTQTWEPLLLAPLERRRCTYSISKSVVIEGGIYMIGGDIGVVYKPREGKWEEIRSLEELGCLGVSYCVIGNVLYCYGSRNGIIWYDFKIRKWMNIKGLEDLPKLVNCDCVVRSVEYGGKIAILWNKYLRSGSGYNNKMIWCAVISLERRNSKEIWGKVEWVDEVLTVPVSCETVFALSATV